jgi:hypothetical protein
MDVLDAVGCIAELRGVAAPLVSQLSESPCGTRF